MYNQMQQQPGTGMLSSKELAYLCDCLKNEEQLAKLAAVGVTACTQPQMKQALMQVAQDRLTHMDQLIRTLEQQGQASH